MSNIQKNTKMNNINQLLSQAKQMQANLAKVQTELENKTVVVEKNGVIITLTANGRVQNIKISPSIIDPNDPEMLEDVILAVYNEAKEKANKIYEDEIKRVTGGMKVPGVF